MTAQDMFEALGFDVDVAEDVVSIKGDIAEVAIIYDDGFYTVRFDLRTESVECFHESLEIDGSYEYYSRDSFNIQMPLLKAICQQCKELGWIDG